MKKHKNIKAKNISVVEWLEKELRKRHTFTQLDIELFKQAEKINSEELRDAFLKGIEIISKKIQKNTYKKGI